MTRRLKTILFLFLTTTVLSIVDALVLDTLLPPKETKTSVVSELSTKNYAVVPKLVDRHVLMECSHQAAEAFEREGGHHGVYGDKPWKSSRIYIDGGQLWKPDGKPTGDAAFVEPIIHAVRRGLAPRLGLIRKQQCDDPELLQRAMPLESAFVNYYVGFGDEPRDMMNHVDCYTNGVPVPLSCVVQGVYDNGTFDSDVPLGTLDCQSYKRDTDLEPVSLSAGDALVLARAWHKPHPVPEGAKRLVFVLFFSELNYV